LTELSNQKENLEYRLKELEDGGTLPYTREEIINYVIMQQQCLAKRDDLKECKKMIERYVSRVTLYKDKIAVEIKIKKDHPDDDPNGRGYHGGPEGIRTLGLCDANAALSQLSHEPTFFTKCSIELIYYTMFHGTCQVQIRKIGPCYFLSFSFRMIKIF
jgi:hypothetical protein